MCVQDLQIVQRAIIKTYSVTPGGFAPARLNVQPPLLWVVARTGAGGNMEIRTDSGNSPGVVLPFDAHMTDSMGTFGFVTRSQVGAALDGPLWVDESFGVTYYVTYMTLAGDVYTAITDNLKG